MHRKYEGSDANGELPCGKSSTYLFVIEQQVCNQFFEMTDGAKRIVQTPPVAFGQKIDCNTVCRRHPLTYVCELLRSNEIKKSFLCIVECIEIGGSVWELRLQARESRRC